RADGGGVTADVASGRDRQFAAERAQVQEPAGGGGLLDDHDAMSRDLARAADLFVGILRARLEVGGARQYGRARGIQPEQIVVVGRAAERIGPIEVGAAGARELE